MTLFQAYGILNPFHNDQNTDERIPLSTDERAYSSTDQTPAIKPKTIHGDHKELLSARWIMAALGCMGFMVVYGLKVNVSVAIIAMVNHTEVAATTGSYKHYYNNNSSNCPDLRNQRELEDGPFGWNEKVQGLILASYFYGYIFTQIPGGWLAEKFSAKHVFGIGAFLNALLTVLSPFCAKISYTWFIVMRLGMGLAGGLTLPAMHVLIAKWAPPQERTKIASTIYAGMALGTLITLPLSGFLASEFGWESVFYVEGGLSILWYILWTIFVYDSPSSHPRITSKEKIFIQESIDRVSGSFEAQKRMSVPWKEMFSSQAVWAIIIAHTCGNWGWYILIMKLPSYMKHILHFDIKSNAGLSSLPFLSMWIFSLGFATLLDALRERKIVTTTTARKIATTISSVIPGICLILVTYVGCNTALAVLFLTLATTFVGGMYSGFLANHIDIAPPFAGTLMGISNTFATVPGIIVPSFVGYMTFGGHTIEIWRDIFIITFGIFVIGAVSFIMIGSGEQQKWSKPPKESKNSAVLLPPKNN